MNAYQSLFVPMFVGTGVMAMVIIGLINYRVIRSGEIPPLSKWNKQRNMQRIYEVHNRLYPESKLVAIAKSLTWLGFAIGMLWLYTSYRSQSNFKKADGVSVSDRAR